MNSGHAWRGTSASFGVGLGEVENVLSACFVPARHYMAAPSDTCLLTGFASGQVRELGGTLEIEGLRQG